jgi:hypothetical protein
VRPEKGDLVVSPRFEMEVEILDETGSHRLEAAALLIFGWA